MTTSSSLSVTPPPPISPEDDELARLLELESALLGEISSLRPPQSSSSSSSSPFPFSSRGEVLADHLVETVVELTSSLGAPRVDGGPPPLPAADFAAALSDLSLAISALTDVEQRLELERREVLQSLEDEDGRRLHDQVVALSREEHRQAGFGGEEGQAGPKGGGAKSPESPAVAARQGPANGGSDEASSLERSKLVSALGLALSAASKSLSAPPSSSSGLSPSSSSSHSSSPRGPRSRRQEA